MRNLIEFKEVYIHKDRILSNEELKKIGITDTGILITSQQENTIILTKDFKFESICKSKGLPIIHFDKLRELYWSLE